MIRFLKKVIYLHRFLGSWSNLCSSSGYGLGPVGRGFLSWACQVIILSIGWIKTAHMYQILLQEAKRKS